jgi:HSP20 family protein
MMKGRQLHKTKPRPVPDRRATAPACVPVKVDPTGLASRDPFAFPVLDPLAGFAGAPFGLVRHIQDELDRAFGLPGPGARSGAWWPAVEVFESGNSLVVRAELPGLGKDDVKVQLRDDGLVLEGERKNDHEEARERSFRSERSYGRFQRVVPLPKGVEARNAKASFADGLLEVRLPLDPGRPWPRRIPVEPKGS